MYTESVLGILNILYIQLFEKLSLPNTFDKLFDFSISYGAHVVNAMATEIQDMGLGKIDRLTLIDPGRWVKKFGKQFGLVNKVVIYHELSK